MALVVPRVVGTMVLASLVLRRVDYRRMLPGACCRWLAKLSIVFVGALGCCRMPFYACIAAIWPFLRIGQAEFVILDSGTL